MTCPALVDTVTCLDTIGGIVVTIGDTLWSQDGSRAFSVPRGQTAVEPRPSEGAFGNVAAVVGGPGQGVDDWPEPERSVGRTRGSAIDFAGSLVDIGDLATGSFASSTASSESSVNRASIAVSRTAMSSASS